MLKERKQLDDSIRKIIKQLTRKETADVTARLKDEKGFPISLASDIFCLRKDPSELSAFELFCVTNIVVKERIKEYYSPAEIKRYESEKYFVDTMKFPLEFEMVQISNDQWIGKFSAKELMKLREYQLINYNTNTQRIMTYVIQNESVDYKITINYKAVKAIKELLKAGAFIPNTITLNINDDQDTNCKYENGKLIIDKIEAFDIIDGFHRYLAMGELHDEDNNWDYPLELRIVAFSENKAKQMIFQEDQQTPMSKTASKSLNQYSYTNVICGRLNEDSSCNLSGQINNYGYVDSAALASALSVSDIKDKKEMIGLCSELKKYINQVTEEDTYYLDHKWTEAQIYVMTYGFYKKTKPSIIVKAMKNIETAEEKAHKTRIIATKKLTKGVQNHIEEVLRNV